jgi:hypothetical protein
MSINCASLMDVMRVAYKAGIGKYDWEQSLGL